MQKDFKKNVLSKEMDFFNEILTKWGYNPKIKDVENIEYVIPLVKGKELPYLEVRIYPLVNDVNVVIDYLPVEPERILPLQRSNSAMKGLEIISRYLEITNSLKDEESIYSYFNDLSHKSNKNLI